MSRLSVFVDESGDLGETSRFYLIAMVLHDQEVSLTDAISRYEKVLRDKSLENIPLHLGPLLNGHDSYSNMDIDTRKKLLSVFQMFAERAVFRYKAFLYQKKWFHDQPNQVVQRFKRDLAAFLLDNLPYFQRFNAVTIHYDNGQKEIAAALRGAFGYTLSKVAVSFRKSIPANYRLLQMADYVCGIELTAAKYEMKTQTATDEVFFGGSSSFKKNFLKKIRRKRM